MLQVFNKTSKQLFEISIEMNSLPLINCQHRYIYSILFVKVHNCQRLNSISSLTCKIVCKLIMKFGKLIQKLAIPEWRACYINYHLLKALLYVLIAVGDAAANQVPDEQPMSQEQGGKTVRNTQELMRIGAESNERFFHLHRAEMQVTFLFFQQKLIELTDKMQDFEGCIFVPKDDAQFLYMLQALYIEANYVKNLYEINLEGQRKILKKHKKIVKPLKLPVPLTLSHSINRLVPVAKNLIDSIETLYLTKSTKPSKQARLHLRKLVQIRQQDTVGSFFFGMGIGVGLSLIGIIIALEQLGVQQNKTLQDQFTRDFPVWRGISFFIIYMWVLAINVYLFERHHVNHKLIFKFDDYHASTHTQAFYRASLFSSVYLILFLLYVVQQIYGEFFPDLKAYLGGIVWIMLIVYVIMPFKIFNWKGRLYMWKLIGRSLIAAFTGVDFPVIWMTDQFISLVNPFKDFAYTICYYSQMSATQSTAEISKCAKKIEVVFVAGCIASSLRILQCIKVGYDAKHYFFTPSFFNTLKYLSSLLTLVFSYLYTAEQSNIFAAWVVFAVVSTLYSFYWDLAMDWGLLVRGSKYWLLRDDLSYGGPKIYYFMMVCNFILRLSWVFTLSPSIVESFKIQPVLFSLLTGSLEICRRGLWNLLRVEKQHLANCESFRAISPADPKTILERSPNQIQIAESDTHDQRRTKLLESLRSQVTHKKAVVDDVEHFVKRKKKQMKQILSIK